MRHVLGMATVLYVAGAVLHALSLLGLLPIHQMPMVVHYVITSVGGFAGVGLIVGWKRVTFGSTRDRVIYGLICIHLLGSAGVHLYSIVTRSNAWIHVFPHWYSYIAVGYFLGFAYFCVVLSRALPNPGKEGQ